MMKQQRNNAWTGQNKGGAAGLYQKQQQTQPVVHATRGRNHGRTLGLSPSVWPSLQQVQQQQQQQNQGNSGMRAVFLGNTGGKKECAGTGVFLPRRTGAPGANTETRKKPGIN